MPTEAYPNTNTAASLASLGYGAAFSIGTGTVPTAATYTQIVECTDVNWSGFMVGKEEVTNLGSPNMLKEYIPALIEPGTISVEGNWVGGDATQAMLLTSVQSRAIQCWQVQALTAAKTKTTTVQAVGFVTKFAPMDKINVDKPVKFSCEIQLTSLITFTEV